MGLLRKIDGLASLLVNQADLTDLLPHDLKKWEDKHGYDLIMSGHKGRCVDNLTENLPAIIGGSRAERSWHAGSAFGGAAYFFFAGASEKVKVGIFVLLFFGVVSFGSAMFRAAPKVQEANFTAATPTPPPN